MDGPQLFDVAAARAAELPSTTVGTPFGPDWDVWKVRGKVFMLQTEVTGVEMVTLKAAPSDSIALREMHPDVSPGYHMNKRHWISLTPGPSLDEELVRELVTESYLLVVEKLPRAQRPIDPTVKFSSKN